MNVLIGPDTNIINQSVSQGFSSLTCIPDPTGKKTRMDSQQFHNRICCAVSSCVALMPSHRERCLAMSILSVSFHRGDRCDFRVSWTRTLKL